MNFDEMKWSRNVVLEPTKNEIQEKHECAQMLAYDKTFGAEFDDDFQKDVLLGQLSQCNIISKISFLFHIPFSLITFPFYLL